MPETPRRLEPTKETIRELFVKSGNECAFPACKRRIIDGEGRFIAQVCHIEAAEPGGERFNAAMTNEERRQFTNLMLLCYEHHVVTNNVDTYPVDKLVAMKKAHEDKYVNAPERIHEAIVDDAARSLPHVPTTLEAFLKTMGWDFEKEQVAVTLESVKELVDRLRQIPIRTREILVSIAQRARSAGRSSHSIHVPFVEVVTACNLEPKDVYEQIQILERYRIGCYERSAEDYTEEIHLYCLEGPWNIWTDLQSYCKASDIPVHEIIVNLRFDLLD